MFLDEDVILGMDVMQVRIRFHRRTAVSEPGNAQANLGEQHGDAQAEDDGDESIQAHYATRISRRPNSQYSNISSATSSTSPKKHQPVPTYHAHTSTPVTRERIPVGTTSADTIV